MTTAFLCGEAGIKPALIDNHADYIGGWPKQIKADPLAGQERQSQSPNESASDETAFHQL